MKEYALPLRDMLGPQLWAASRMFRCISHDPLRTPAFWESWLATTLGGTTTPPGMLHDVDVVIWGRHCAVECKFSNEFFMRYRPIRGKDWSRFVFKWALPRGNSGKDTVDAIVLIGVDGDDNAFSWCVPRDAISRGCRSITVASPRVRVAGTIGPMDDFAVPFTEILPAVARVCHNRHDAAARRAGTRERRRSVRAVGELFG